MSLAEFSLFIKKKESFLFVFLIIFRLKNENES